MPNVTLKLLAWDLDLYIIQRLNKDATALAALLAFLGFLNSSIIGLTIEFSYYCSSSLSPYY